MHFLRISGDSTRDDLAEAATHLRKRQINERDPWIQKALADDVDELIEMWALASA